ncbi:MAG: carbon storage regulator [Planctomycetaceae bacterium]|jgi:carbon storage regulator|nr:carbon storage regulator [Planctomycetaceae bacterium]
MLVLSRKEGERIRIGDDIYVTIVHAAKDRVRIGIDAPLNTVILRDELAQNSNAADSDVNNNLEKITSSKKILHNEYQTVTS